MHNFDYKLEYCYACHRIINENRNIIPHSCNCSQKKALIFHINNSSVIDGKENNEKGKLFAYY